MTIEDLLKVLENKVTKEEFQAFRLQVSKFFENYKAMLFYLKPETGIPAKDLDQGVQNEINRIKDAYFKKQPIAAEDLPSNVATLEFIEKWTKGNIYPPRCPDIIDEIVVARGDKTSIKGYINSEDTKLQSNINLCSKKTELITDINALLEGVIDKERTEPHDHNDMPLESRQAENCHTIEAIKDLQDELDKKTDNVSVIAAINASEETEMINGAKVNLSALQHNTLDGRTIPGCHTIEAVDGLQAELNTLANNISSINQTLEGAIGDHPNLADALKCIVDMIKGIDTELASKLQGYSSQTLSCMYLFSWES